MLPRLQQPTHTREALNRERPSDLQRDTESRQKEQNRWRMCITCKGWTATQDRQPASHPGTLQVPGKHRGAPLEGGTLCLRVFPSLTHLPTHALLSPSQTHTPRLSQSLSTQCLSGSHTHELSHTQSHAHTISYTQSLTVFTYVVSHTFPLS